MGPSLAAPTALIAGFLLEGGSVRLALAASAPWCSGWSSVAGPPGGAPLPVAAGASGREYLWLLVPVWGGTLAALAIMRYLAL